MIHGEFFDQLLAEDVQLVREDFLSDRLATWRICETCLRNHATEWAARAVEASNPDNTNLFVAGFMLGFQTGVRTQQEIEMRGWAVG